MARSLLDRLDMDGIDYALGGALALGYWSDPRGTLDVDLTVFLSVDELPRLFESLRSLGVETDEDKAHATACSRGMFATWLEGYRLDVFLPDIPLYESARKRRASVSFGGRPTWIWSAEDTVLFKLMYFRTKDRADIETVVAIQGSRLDLAYIRSWLVELVGPGDERSEWFESCVAPPRE